MAEIKDYITYADDRGTINISDDVVAVAAGSAALEVDGVAGLYSAPGREIIGRKSMSRGVKIFIEDKSISVDISVLAEMGASVSKVGENVQSAVKTAVEDTTGLNVTAVNVHICGITAKKK